MSSIDRNNIEALKQRLLEPSNIILSYANILKEKSVSQSLEEFEDELNKIIDASQKLIDEINQAVSDDVLNLESNEVLEYQKKTRHDLRNIINIILGYSEMILEDLDPLHQNYPDIKNLLEETKKFNSNLEELVQLNVSTKEQKIN
jgi:signal transduction histidine kinase